MFHGVGLYRPATAIIAAKHGIRITGVDINSAVVEKTNAGELHIIEPVMCDLLKEVTASRMLHASTSSIGTTEKWHESSLPMPQSRR